MCHFGGSITVRRDAALSSDDVLIWTQVRLSCIPFVIARFLEHEYTQAARGLGVFMFQEAGDYEWYAGQPYLSPNQYIIARQGGISSHSDRTSEVTHQLFRINSSGDGWMKRDMDVRRDLYVRDDLFVSDDMTINDNLTVNGTLTVRENGYFNSNIGIRDTTPSNRLDINTDSTNSGLDPSWCYRC